VEWKVGRKKGKGVCVRDKKNKLSASPDQANHPMIVTEGLGLGSGWEAHFHCYQQEWMDLVFVSFWWF